MPPFDSNFLPDCKHSVDKVLSAYEGLRIPVRCMGLIKSVSKASSRLHAPVGSAAPAVRTSSGRRWPGSAGLRNPEEVSPGHDYDDRRVAQREEEAHSNRPPSPGGEPEEDSDRAAPSVSP